MLGLALALFALWILYAIILPWVVGDALQTRGAWGDQFGGLNALFSALALAGIIVTVRMQSEELRLQRRELELTRIELKRSAEGLSAQAMRDAFDSALQSIRAIERTARCTLNHNGEKFDLSGKDALFQEVRAAAVNPSHFDTVRSLTNPMVGVVVRTIHFFQDRDPSCAPLYTYNLVAALEDFEALCIWLRLRDFERCPEDLKSALEARFRHMESVVIERWTDASISLDRRDGPWTMAT